MFLLRSKKGNMVDMKGKLCMITGANSGIGYHTAKGLAKMNATVVMVVRDLEKGQKAFDKIKKATRANSLYLMHCDLSSMKSVDRFSREFSNRFTCLHVLVNNAGAAFSKRKETEEGFEKTIATNYFGLFKLTKNLLPLLKEYTPSRIINLSSGMHKTGKIDWDDFMFEKKFKGMHVYATTKLMVTAYTYALAKRLEGTGISANVVEPGFVATNLGANMGSLRDRIAFAIVRPMQISAERGAETSIWAATNPDLKNVSGKTLSKKSETKSAAITYDTKFQDRLWETTIKLLML
jgi:NAD(P)-dependent dehydrogenase (short-subunit alcohol dehydrogenase family)